MDVWLEEPYLCSQRVVILVGEKDKNQVNRHHWQIFIHFSNEWKTVWNHHWGIEKLKEVSQRWKKGSQLLKRTRSGQYQRDEGGVSNIITKWNMEAIMGNKDSADIYWAFPIRQVPGGEQTPIMVPETATQPLIDLSAIEGSWTPKPRVGTPQSPVFAQPTNPALISLLISDRDDEQEFSF